MSIAGIFLVVELLSSVQLFETPWSAAHLASLSFTIFQSLLKLMSIESMMPSNHLILCHPLLLLPSIFPSILVVSNELTPCISRSKYWRFSFTISPSNKYSGLISFRIDWFDLLAVQGYIGMQISSLMDLARIFRTVLAMMRGSLALFLVIGGVYLVSHH